MAKVTRALAAVVLLYALYLYTLPAAPRQAAPVAALSRETRILTLPALRRYAAVISLPEGGQARLCAARLARQGGAGLILEQAGEYRVYCALFDHAADADRACQRVAEQTGYTPQTELLSCPGARVKLSANAAQMEAVTQAVGRLEELPGHMRQLAGTLDAGETRRQEAQALTEVWRTQALDALEALEKTLAGEEDAFCRRVTEALAELCDDLTAAAEAAGESGLSSLLRRGGAAAEWAYVRLVNDMNP